MQKEGLYVKQFKYWHDILLEAQLSCCIYMWISIYNSSFWCLVNIYHTFYFFKKSIYNSSISEGSYHWATSVQDLSENPITVTQPLPLTSFSVKVLLQNQATQLIFFQKKKGAFDVVFILEERIIQMKWKYHHFRHLTVIYS